MTVPSTRFREDYAGNGSATSFPYAFRIFKATDLVVTKTDSSGNETTLTLGTHYTVTGAGSYNGGAVVLTTALPTSYRLTIERVLAIRQDTDLRNQGEFLAETHEDAFDRLTMIVQRLAGYLGMGQGGTLRTLLLGTGDVDGAGAFRARGNRISGLGDPVDDTDAAGKRWTQEQIAGAVNVNGSSMLGVFAITIDTIAGASGLLWPDKATVIARGRDTINDGGGGQLRFLKGSLATADEVTVYTVTGGRLVRENWLATGVNILWAGAKIDAADNKAAIDRALNSYTTVNVPFGIFNSSGGHNLQGKSIIGINRDVSIIKATGTNSGVTLFTGGQTNPSSPGTWGSGGAFRLERLGIHGNWDGTSGLTLVGNYKVGVLAANYNATLNSALVKAISTAYTFIKDCHLAYAYEHALMFYGNGYSTIGDNVIATCRGSGTWFAGDKSTPESIASSITTSTIYRENKVTTCRGGMGGLVMNLIYGCSIRDNLFEANYYGYALYENADCKFGGNYVELGYIVGDNVGPAPVYVDPSAWGTTFDDIYNPIGNYVPDNVRGAVVMDRSGIRLKATPGYGGIGIQFPAVQAPSADANTLDDYEEGTWTPAGNNIAFAAASGKYTKIGNVVSITFSVTFPTNSDTSIAYVTGLPFAPTADAGVAFSSAGGRAIVDFTYKAASGNTFLQPMNAAGSAFMINSNFSSGILSGSATYLT